MTMHIYPTLALIDQALGADSPGFATSKHAASLESDARALADEYWSEHVWLTGRITSAAFRAVSEPLALRWQELERATWQDAHLEINQEQATVVVAA